MIKAFAPNETTVELKIKNAPTRKEFDADLARMRGDINQADLIFDAGRNIWKVKNAGNYRHIPYIKAALEDRAQQLTFAL
jgi:hypothetical protein